jgi:integrase/recombinase XerD
MFEKFFDSPARIKALRNCSSGPLLEGFAEKLHRHGYAEITARKHIRAAEHFMYWTGRDGTSTSKLSERFLEDFYNHLKQCHCSGYGHSNPLHLLNGARLFLKHLRSAGVITTPVAELTTQEPELLIAFCQWMRQQRGTSDPTLYNYSLSIRELLKCLEGDPGKFNAHTLRQFVLEKSQKCGWAAAKQCTTALRMFLRFLIADGKCATGLDAAIPVLAHWRQSSLPRYLQPEAVERIISSCNLSSLVGRRDHAILLLLARLAFRAGDILQLRMKDIDWEGAGILVSGKGHQQTRLPLTQEVGDALVCYLLNGRPSSDTDVVFIRSRAPFRAFKSHCAVSVIVTRAMRRAGVVCQNRGAAHLLRHSAATSMLQQGASLQDIAVILRHRSIQTTQIYAKVDVTALRQIAQPWPEVKSC